MHDVYTSVTERDGADPAGEPGISSSEDDGATRSFAEEELIAFACDLHATLLTPRFAESLVRRSTEILRARAAILSFFHGAHFELAALYDPARPEYDRELRDRLQRGLANRSTATHSASPAASAADLLGPDLAAHLGWQSLACVPLSDSNREPLGMLYLADCSWRPSAPPEKCLQLLGALLSAAVENAHLFERMDQANRHWMEIFDSITDFIVVHDASGKVLRVNATLAEFIGVRPAQLIGVSMCALLATPAAASGWQACPFCRTGGTTSDEYVYPLLERTYWISTSTICDAVNDALRTIHVLKDITDRREAERRYRELFDNIQEGLFFCSPDGRFIEVNDALVRMLGYQNREELLQADPESQLYVSSRRRRFHEAMERTGGVLRNFEEVLRRKDGSLIYCLQNVFAVRDAQDRVLQYRGAMLDITELKNFQAELQRERDFSSKILNHTQSLILVVDTAGLVSYANQRCYTAGNYSESDLIGHKLVELVLPQRRHLMAHSVELCLLGQQVDNLELPIQLGGGRTGQFSLNLSPMRDEQGTVNSIVVVMTDITDTALLQAKLMHAEKMAAVGQLVSGVAHEVNNPLTAVLGFADLLLDNPAVPESAKKDLAIILQEAQRTKTIVQNLLSFARQMPPRRSPVQVNEILRRTLALRSYDFANSDVKVTGQLQEDLPEVEGDAHQLQQVFLNILNNAYDAVRETGRSAEIEVSTSCQGEFIEIVFRDNGIGIRSPERIFDPFFTTKDVGKGTGLGLSICYGIVHEHGGEISCSNNAGAPGAAFAVRLPLQRAPARAPGEQA
jgi:two-component system NtrC family sensor kinase